MNPWRHAEAGTSVEGEVPVSSMARLGSLLRNDSGSAAYNLSFALDERNSPVITGRVAAEVQVICQRCLEPMALKVEAELRVGIAASAEAASFAEFESIIVEDDRLSLAALVEDELILALPSAPAHPPGECRPPGYAGAVEPVTGAAANRPFAVLAALKSGNGRRRQ